MPIFFHYISAIIPISLILLLWITGVSTLINKECAEYVGLKARYWVRVLMVVGWTGVVGVVLNWMSNSR